MIFLVTGGSRGLGASIVNQALAEGHDVAFTYVQTREKADEVVAQAREKWPERCCRAYRLEVRDSAQVENVVDEVAENFEAIEVLVNCAGTTRSNLVVSMADEEWCEVLETNLYGPFYVCRQVLSVMLGQRFGRIINISSIQHSGGTGQANYAASKAGLHGLTKTLAKEYGRRGITANVVVPGFFETDMTLENVPQSIRDHWAEHCPMPGSRLGQPPELARVVTFLASEGGNYINGQVIHVTGGLDFTD